MWTQKITVLNLVSHHCNIQIGASQLWFFETAQRLSAQLSPAVKTNESRLSLQTSSSPIEKPNIWCCNVCRNSKLAHIGFTSKMSLLDLQKMMETWCCVAATMCASARKMMLRSTDHVCKCKERYHPPPHPTPAATMCASQRKMMLRSSDHVCKCKERYHPPPHPTPPHPTPPHPTMWIPGKPPVPRDIWHMYFCLFVSLQFEEIHSDLQDCHLQNSERLRRRDCVFEKHFSR